MESTDRKVRHQDKGAHLGVELANPFVKSAAQRQYGVAQQFGYPQENIKVIFEDTSRMRTTSQFSE